VGGIKGSDFLLLGHILIIKSCFKKKFNCLLPHVIVVLVEQTSVYEFLAQNLAFVNFSRHELAAEAVLIVDRFQKIFFYEGLE